MKQRTDLRLVELGLAPSREKARRLIMAGLVYAGESRIDKASETVEDGQDLTVRGQDIPFVGRGGLKLEKALNTFAPRVAGEVYLDIGASTGGFTDCLLQRGAALVYAIDVGHGQLDWRLRQDERVRVMERTNARYLTADLFDPAPHGAVMDVSFISILKILPALANVLPADGELISLIKPQFEAGARFVGKGGVVRDPEVHRQVLTDTAAALPQAGFFPQDLTDSPVRGAGGNVEFLLYARRSAENAPSAADLGLKIQKIIEKTHIHEN